MFDFGTDLEVEDYFSFQIFFIILRETIESAIIVSVLLSFITQNCTDSVTGKLTVSPKVYRSMKMQVWAGAIGGFAICLAIGAIFITLFYFIGTDLWSYTERIWEGLFSILSSIIIAIMGVALLRINSMKSKWKASLVDSFKRHHHNVNDDVNVDVDVDVDVVGEQTLKERYFLAFLPFITTLREGLEAVVFVGGIGVNQPLSSFPLAIIAGALLGFGIGYALYKGGNGMSIQYFLIASTCFLYLVAAGLMSRGIWFLELEQFVQRCGQDTSETGSGPGSYDIGNTIWHVNCCNGLKDGGWMLFNALLGWTNTATYGSVTSYILFWVAIVIMLKMKAIFEDEGIVPFVPVRWQLKKIRKRLSLVGVLVSEIEEERENGGNIGGSGVESAGSAGSGIPIGDLEPLLGSANASAGASAGASSN